MSTKLYVGNLSEDASSQALRARFAAVATVLDVELAVDRYSGRLRGHAFVTMASPEDARIAISQLDGSVFDERRLRVNAAGEEREDSGSGRSRGASKPAVRLTMQFRESQCMTYELDCNGVALSLRMFPNASETSWRIEATLPKVEGELAGIRVSGTGATRALALAEVTRAWEAEHDARGLQAVRWSDVTEALLAVRAV